MNPRRRIIVAESKKRSPTAAAESLLTEASPHCGSEQLHVSNADACPRSDEFSSNKEALYERLAPIVSKVAYDAAEKLVNADDLNDKEPFFQLSDALNESFDSFYLSLNARSPAASDCPHFQDLEYIIRPGIHTAVAAIDLLMTALDLQNLKNEYEKATRLIQRIALLHADSLSDTLAELYRIIADGSDPIVYNGARMEFSDDFTAYLDSQENQPSDGTRIGCPVMFDAASMRKLWTTYGQRYTSHYNNRLAA